MVGILVSFWDGLFSRDMLVSARVDNVDIFSFSPGSCFFSPLDKVHPPFALRSFECLEPGTDWCEWKDLCVFFGYEKIPS